MWCFVGNLFGLFLIRAWDVRKHSDLNPCTGAEFAFNEVSEKVLTSPGTHLWASSLSSLMPSSSIMAGKVIATLFGRRLTPDWGFTSSWHFWQV